MNPFTNGHMTHISAHVASSAPDVNGLDTESWTIALTGKDLVIMVLSFIMVTLIACLCVARSGGAGVRRKYRVVSMNGDSEMEEFQK